MSARATIDGIVILNATAVTWHLSPGTQPYTTSVLVATKAVKDSNGLVGKKTSLVVEGTKDSFTASNVYIIGVQPGPHPQTTLITIADKRWLWPRKHVLRRYNVRRKTGDRRLVTEGVPEQITVTVDDYYYELATLKNGKAWTAKDAFDDAIGYVNDGDRPDASGVTFRDTPFEGVEIDDPGDSAIDRIRALSTGINMFVALDGTVTLVDETDNTGQEALKKFGSVVVGKGIAGFVNRAGLRPKWIDVLFSIESELKFTSIDEGNTYNLKGDTRKYCENVLPLPDRTTTVGGRALPRGTYVTMEEAFAAWGTPSLKDPGSGVTITPQAISHALVQLLWFAGDMERMFVNFGELASADNDWAARIRAVRTHYRQTYRISHYWMDRIKYLTASRVGIVDRENGTRAPAMVAADYAIVPNTRGRFFYKDGMGLVINVTDSYNDSWALCKPAACVLEVVDSELGIVRLNYATDSRNLGMMTIPGAMENSPVMNLAKGGDNPLTLGGACYGTASNSAKMAASHHVAFVLTAAPSAPNDNGQLLAVRIKAEDVGAYAGGEATGPGMEIRVGIGATSAAVARFMWTDASEATVDRVFGKGHVAGGSISNYSQGQALRNAGLLVDDAEIQNIAKATAAAVYSTLKDRVMGTQAFRLGKAELKPTGNLVEVAFTLSPDGALNTTGSFNPSVGRVDVTSLLSSDVRRKLFRLAQP